MKNFFIIVLMILIVVGTCFGVKAEIDAWNKKYHPTSNVEEAEKMIEKAKDTVDDVNDKVEDDLDLSELQ
ncbi:MAG: hypothetical protein IJ715_01705 [Bacilli bacterium]|nr:hypothetical protein [Bacilli bacterium]